MTVITATVPMTHIKAALLFAAKKDARSYLNGIMVEFSETETVLVATNNATLAAFRTNADPRGSTGFSRQSVILPRDLCEAVAKMITGTIQIVVAAGASEQRAVTLIGVDAGQSISGVATNGGYPFAWRNTVHATCDGTVAQYDLEMLSRFAKAAKLLGRKYALIAHNGDKAAVVAFDGCDEFAGAIMPLRIVAAMACPAWVHGAPIAAEAV